MFPCVKSVSRFSTARELEQEPKFRGENPTDKLVTQTSRKHMGTAKTET